MTDRSPTLAEVVADELFPAVDVRLREGGHIDDRDLDHFSFLEEARPQLDALYDRYGCDLRRSVDGYYFLEPRGAQFGQRTLTAAEMLVGQVLCLLRLDPATLRTSGRVERQRVLEVLDQFVGAERIGRALNPRRRKRTMSVEAEEIRRDVDGAIRTLARLGFVDAEGDLLLLRSPLLRFAEHVVPGKDQAAELVQLVSGAPAADAGEDWAETDE